VHAASRALVSSSAPSGRSHTRSELGAHHVRARRAFSVHRADSEAIAACNTRHTRRLRPPVATDARRERTPAAAVR